MKSFLAFFISCLLIVVLISSCKKNGTTVPPINGKGGKPTIGTDTTINNTTYVTIGKVAIQYQHTSPCSNNGELFTFSLVDSEASNQTNYTWSLGDGGSGNGTYIQHHYTEAGYYTITIQIKDTGSLQVTTASFTIYAWGENNIPHSTFYIQYDFPERPNYVTFNSLSYLGRGAIIDNYWEWGDNTSEHSAVSLTRHLFPDSSIDVNYPVKLTVTANSGCKSDTTVYVYVPAHYNITGDFNAVAIDPCGYEQILFTPTATNVPTGAVYEWDVKENGYLFTGYNIKYHYKYMNDYDVTLRIKLNGRTIYTTHKLVHANGEDAKPHVYFNTTLHLVYPTTVVWSFNDSSNVAHGGFDSYQWDFGNGKTDNDFNSYVETSYPRKSVATYYTVRLIATANGCADTAYHSVQVPAL